MIERSLREEREAARFDSEEDSKNHRRSSNDRSSDALHGPNVHIDTPLLVDNAQAKLSGTKPI